MWCNITQLADISKFCFSSKVDILNITVKKNEYLSKCVIATTYFSTMTDLETKFLYINSDILFLTVKLYAVLVLLHGC